MAVPRILLISSNSSARGGGERYLVYLTQALTEVGCNVSALLSDVDYMDGWARSLAEAGADVHRLPLLGLRSRPLRIVQSISDRGQQQAIAAFCRELAPQAILVNQQYDEDGLDFVAGALAAEVAPVAGVMHMPMTATKDSRPLGRWRGKLLQRWYRRHPYRLALVSEGSRREFEQYYDRPRPTYVLHHGCTFPSDNAESAAGMDKPDLPPEWSSDVPTVAFLGQLVPQKNLLLTADAWVWTRQQGVRSRLLLVGDGSEREAIARRLTAAPVPETDWYVAGWQPDPELYYQAMDVYATTSHFEGLPLSLIEVAGRGIPAIATDFNGAADVAERAPWVTVVPERTVEAVGGALQQAIVERDARQHQARAGREQFRQYFSLERMARDTLIVLGLSPA